MSRLLQNLVRTPGRAVAGLIRQVHPAGRLQRRADRDCGRWLRFDRRELLESLPGQTTNRKYRLLAYLARMAPADGWIVEIGSFKGKSTGWLVEASQSREKPLPVAAIDPHLTGSWDDFCKTCERLKLDQRGLYVFRDFSHGVGAGWTQPISLLWVDGGHEYEDVIHDIEDFVPQVVPGGWVVFDDAKSDEWPGVGRAVEERMSVRKDFVFYGHLKHFALYQKAVGRA
ncbi:MAG: class I SAM-dependent methyltransferase [Planctomycetia bacterium]